MMTCSWTKPFLIALLCLTFSPAIKAQTTAPTIGNATIKRPVHIYYIDPVNGSMNGDGSPSRPWSTLEAVLQANLINGQDKTSGVVHARDLIYLMTGNHGDIHIDPSWNGGKTLNTDFITIQAAPGNKPQGNCVLFRFKSCDNSFEDISGKGRSVSFSSDIIFNRSVS